METVQLEITRECPLRCEFCRSRREPGQISDEQFARFLLSLRRSFIRHVTLTGGEPTLHPHLVDFLRDLLETGHTSTLLTCGIGLTESLIEFCCDSGVQVAISIHSQLPHVHDEIVGLDGAWGHAMSRLDLFERLGKPVIVNCTITRRNFKDVFKFVAFLSHYRCISQFNLNKFIPTKNRSAFLSIGLPEVKEAIGQMIEASRESGKRLSIDSVPLCRIPLNFRDFVTACPAGTSFGYVDVNGDVRSCTYASFVDWNVFTGRCLSQESREESHLECLSYGKTCCDCDLLEACGGGCGFFTQQQHLADSALESRSK